MNANQRGIVIVVACMAAYTVNDTLVKQIIRSVPIGEVIVIRGAMGLALIGAAALLFGHGRQLGLPLRKGLLSRSIFDGLSTACFIATLAHLPLADLAAVLQIAPLIITALSVLIYHEVVGWRRWTAIGVGFAGALLVIRPTPSAFDAWAIVGTFSALFAALREMTTRRIESGVPTLVIAFWGLVGITLFGSLFGLVEDWKPVPPQSLLLLFCAAAFVAVATFLMALGFRNVDLSVVAPFRYSYLITSTASGFIVFGELPDRLSAIGAALIVGSGIYALHREAVRQRDLTGRATPAA
jgi:drug/metabolite transporter (DMT)-like permease